MNSYAIEVSEYADEAEEEWNQRADGYNQWDHLSLEEQHEIIGKKLKEK